jgi:hypothetical protein
MKRAIVTNMACQGIDRFIISLVIHHSKEKTQAFKIWGNFLDRVIDQFSSQFAIPQEILMLLQQLYTCNLLNRPCTKRSFRQY